MKDLVASSHRSCCLLALSALALALPLTAAESEVSVPTSVHFLVGFPSETAGEDSGTLFAPGTVFPVEGGPAGPRWDPETKEPGDLDSFFELTDNLKRTLRLDSISAKYRIMRPFQLDQVEELPRPVSDSPISASATLLGATDELATYRVQFFDGEEALTDSRVAVKRGGRAVVGGLDGEAAPYIFLVLQPLTPEDASQVSWLSEDFTPPRALSRPAPQYTPEAKEERIQGMVILQTVIDTDGNVGDINVLKGQPQGLTEAAIEAVRTWTFEPALNPDGEPTAVYYNLTLNFRLGP